MLKITRIPAGEAVSSDFDIRLNGQSAAAYAARVSAVPHNRAWPGHQRDLSQTELASFLTFVMGDEVVEVELLAARDFEEAVIRPLSENITPTVSGRRLSFVITRPGQYTVELDGPHHALHIFADPAVDFGVKEGDPGVIWFGPGVHRPGLIDLKSGQTLYIDQDAVVYGGVRAVQEERVRILGYGVLDGSEEKRRDDTLLLPYDLTRGYPVKGTAPAAEPVQGSVLLEDRDSFLSWLEENQVLNGCVRLYACRNTLVQGIVCRDSASFTIIEANCEDTVCDNVKLIGMWRYNSDGIDLFNCRRCVIRNSFLRNFDDCVVLKGITGWDTWSMEDILVENCVLWCDWGRSLEIGAETCAPEYRGIVFRDCDCIHNETAAMDIQNGDRGRVHDVLFEDIRVEYSRYDVRGQLQDTEDEVFEAMSRLSPLAIAELYTGLFSNDWVYGENRAITFRNIQVFTEADQPFPHILLNGVNFEHTTSGIRFEGVFHNGRRLENAMQANIHSNYFTRDITVE